MLIETQGDLMRLMHDGKNMRITPKEYALLPYLGKELHDRMLNEQPKTYHSMADKGTLLPYLMKEGNRLCDILDECLAKGMDVAGAEEIARSNMGFDTWV